MYDIKRVLSIINCFDHFDLLHIYFMNGAAFTIKAEMADRQADGSSLKYWFVP